MAEDSVEVRPQTRRWEEGWGHIGHREEGGRETDRRTVEQGRTGGRGQMGGRGSIGCEKQSASFRVVHRHTIAAV